jgi:P-type conjugative transfer ATPase TrbB
MDTTSGTPKTMDARIEAKRRLEDKLRADLGPLVRDALEDPKTVEIMLNADGRLWQERLGEPMKEIGWMDRPQAEALIWGVASAMGTVIDAEHPLLEGELPLDGSRFAAQMPPASSAPTFTLRKRAVAIFSLQDYVDAGVMTPAVADALKDAIRKGINVLVAGGTGSGKTTLVNALIAELARLLPRTRVLILEDAVELQCSLENHVQWRTCPGVDMTQLLRTALRGRPDRILVGEVRGPEAFDLLRAWNTGHPGGFCTLHADDARLALSRFELLVGSHPHAPRESRIPAFIAEARPLIVHLERAPGGRRVREALSVTGFSNGNYLTQPVL